MIKTVNISMIDTLPRCWLDYSKWLPCYQHSIQILLIQSKARRKNKPKNNSKEKL